MIEAQKFTLAEKVRNNFIKSWHPLLLLSLMGLLVYYIYAEGSETYRWQWYRVWRYFGRMTDSGFVPGPLFDGFVITLQLAAISLVFAMLFGIVLTILRLSISPVARLVSTTTLEIIRNTPLLLQLFLVYFLVAPVFSLTPFASAVLSLALFEGVYLSEVFRAGIISLPRSQWEAAFSLGMSTAISFRVVIMPQAFRRSLLPIVSQLISLIKDTSLVSAIAVADLTMQARNTISETFLSFEIWLLVAAMYLFLTTLVSIPAYLLRKFSRVQTKGF